MTPLSPEAEAFLAAGGTARPWPTGSVEGRAYANRLRDAGVEMALRRFDGLVHAFAVMSAFPMAQAEVIDEIAIAIDRWLRPTVV